MNYPIKTPSGRTYITIIDVNQHIFNIRLDNYRNVSVVLDKKVIPDMIKILTEIQNENIHK
jgi:hypothetical protein